MAQELELCEYSTVHEVQGTETNSGNTEPSERRLFRTGIIILAVLCVIQATLNISLRLGLHSREDTDQCPFNSSTMANFLLTDWPQQNATQPCPCCSNLLRRLAGEYKALETERDILQDLVKQLTSNKTEGDNFSASGSGSLEEYFDQEIN